jgi:hypothetical protein
MQWEVVHRVGTRSQHGRQPRHPFDRPTQRRVLVKQVDQWLCQSAQTSGTSSGVEGANVETQLLRRCHVMQCVWVAWGPLTVARATAGPTGSTLWWWCPPGYGWTGPIDFDRSDPFQTYRF